MSAAQLTACATDGEGWLQPAAHFPFSGRSMARPNVLLVVVDQLRYDCIGFSNRYPVSTPNLDRFAAQSVWFSQSYTPIPTCCPARQSFLTGKRAEALGTLWNYDLGPRIPSLGPDHWTWSRALSESGYSTGYVGKWHVSDRHGPQDFGFDTYISVDDYEAFRIRKHPDVHYRPDYLGEDDPLPLEDARTHWLTERAIDRMAALSRGGAPWLLRLDLPEPHLPCRPAEPFASLYGPRDVPRWDSFGETFRNKPYIQRQQLLNWRLEDYDWDDWAPIVARYYNIIAQVDDAFGRLLRALDSIGAADETVVIFTSDHGDMCGAHRMLDKHYVLYDDVVRVPLAIRLPGQVERVSTDAFVYNMLDLAPTIMSMAGLQPPPGLHGIDLTQVVYGCKGFETRPHVVSTYNGQQFGLYSQRMLRDRRWKYVWNATDVDELYDLEIDPAELHNVSGAPENRTRLAQMRSSLYEELVTFGDTLVANPWLQDQFREADRKLGPPD
ncbi:sulfatase-like hydrolase/transferase [Devosia geojensis]|uniref:sulfatase-like hydrolase/transferase n=1 Tax=Devosia geojensis TaxID=443610 RepID=UPI000A034B3F|nr:sulfatase-like hydrolase/transferase [Devosia geojensis]